MGDAVVDAIEMSKPLDWTDSFREFRMAYEFVGRRDALVAEHGRVQFDHLYGSRLFDLVEGIINQVCGSLWRIKACEGFNEALAESGGDTRPAGGDGEPNNLYEWDQDMTELWQDELDRRLG